MTAIPYCQVLPSTTCCRHSVELAIFVHSFLFRKEMRKWCHFKTFTHHHNTLNFYVPFLWVGIATRYGLEGSRIESRWGTRLSAPDQTGPEAHPASCKMGTGEGVKAGWTWS